MYQYSRIKPRHVSALPVRLLSLGQFLGSTKQNCAC